LEGLSLLEKHMKYWKRMCWTEVASLKEPKHHYFSYIHYSSGVAIRKTGTDALPHLPNEHGVSIDILPLKMWLGSEDPVMHTSSIDSPILASDPSQNLLIMNNSVCGARFLSPERS